jgi:phosphatidylserine/phosphatidylglycerophosphate/cardiolipin synthase-like enzyme
MEDYFSGIPEYINDSFRNSEVLLAHELANLTDRSVVRNAVENRDRNPNSIMKLIYDVESPTADDAVIRIVSPYLFLSKYNDKDGNVLEDSVADIHQWLSENPDHRFEIITNSVMTSDNILAQSVIDMEVGPRLLLTPELEQAWLSGLKKGEFNPEVTESEEWRRLVNHPQIFVYQTGKLDASMFGNGDKHYGKLHAKFLIGDEIGFVGTSNFDYRSILYNNEMGFFYRNEQAHENLNDIFESLKDTSYRWGSPEWLQMRKAVMDKGGMKAWGTRKQRFLYKMLKKTGFIWLI